MTAYHPRLRNMVKCSFSQNVVFGMINYAGEHFVDLIEGLALMRQGGGDTPETFARICWPFFR